MNQKDLFLILAFSFITGCVYDPPTGELMVYNRSDSVIYFYLTDQKTLPDSPKIELFVNRGYFDIVGIKPIGDTFSPNYRVDAYDAKTLYACGTYSKPELCLGSDTGYFFFIKEEVMREYEWKDIVSNQMYVQRQAFTDQMLDSTHYNIVYYP